MFTNKKGFTLIELLVVVLIIGILAAIAVPQYQKAVLKADLHKGVSLVETIYQAQQAYLLAHGNFATDIDDLDIDIPKDSSCEKIIKKNLRSNYKCNFGAIGIYDSFSNIQYQTKNAHIAYLHYLKDYQGTTSYEAGKRYCFAGSSLGAEVCQILGGEKIHDGNNAWKFGIYKINTF